MRLYLFIQALGDSIRFPFLFESFTKYLSLRVLPTLTSASSASLSLAVPSFSYSQIFAEHLLCFYVFTSDSISALVEITRGRQADNNQSDNLHTHKKMYDLVLFSISEVQIHLRCDEREREKDGGRGGRGGKKRETFQSPS